MLLKLYVVDGDETIVGLALACDDGLVLFVLEA